LRIARFLESMVRMDRRFYLLIGIFLLAASAAFMLVGEAFTFLERPIHIVSRAEDPKRYWLGVVGYFLVGFFLICFYLYHDPN